MHDESIRCCDVPYQPYPKLLLSLSCLVGLGQDRQVLQYEPKRCQVDAIAMGASPSSGGPPSSGVARESGAVDTSSVSETRQTKE